MPRKRERTTTKGSWTIATLEYAVNKAKKGTSVYKLSKETNIPYSTLKKRVRAAKANEEYKMEPRLGRSSVFTVEQESILANYLRDMSNKFFGLTRTQFRKLSYDMAIKFDVAHRFNNMNKAAGTDWLTGFLSRHPDLSIRKPESTSINRILGFNREEVGRFFTNLDAVMVDNNFGPTQIYNMDETGVTTVQETEKIIAPRGQKRVGAMTSWERGKNVTVICAMSASGAYVPPLFIFPRQRHSPQLEKDGPAGAVYTCSHNGWTNESIFIIWLKHFISVVKPSAEKPVLLIMDNHNSHSTLEAWEMARTNHIIMLTIPPHTSHRLQPLDVTFFGPLKRAYNKECDSYMKSKNMVKITPYDIASLFNKAFTKVASLEKGISGFRATGIYPMNSEVFGDEDFFDASAQIDQNIQPVAPSITDVNPIQLSSNETQQPIIVQASLYDNPTPSTSNAVLSANILSESAIIDHQPEDRLSPSVINNNNQPNSDFTSILTALSPNIQCGIPKESSKTRNKQHSEIITSTPMKIIFEEKKKKKDEKEAKAAGQYIKGNKDKGNQTKGKKIKGKQTGKSTKRKAIEIKIEGMKQKRTNKKNERMNKAKRNLFLEADSSSEDLDENLLCDDESEYSDEENVCAICLDAGKNRELWYRCRNCGQWAHSECSGSDNPGTYICSFCV